MLAEVQPTDNSRGHSLIAELVAAYWKRVYCYLRRKGYDNEDGKDLTQGFFEEVVLGRGLIQRADPRRGRFRTLLLTALDRYVANIHRKQTAQKRIPRDRLIPLESVEIGNLPPALSDLSCEESFTHTWIADLLHSVIEQVQADCRNRGMAVHWTLLEQRVLNPILNDEEPPSLAELCAEQGITAPTKASNMIFAVKRGLQATLQRHVRQSVASQADMSEEMADLTRFLAKGQQYLS